MRRNLIRFMSLFLALFLFVSDFSVLTNAASTVSVPSPSGYFGSNPKVEKDDEYTVYTYSGHKTFPEAKVDQYVKDLKAKGLKLGNEGNMQDGDKLRRMDWNGEPTVVIWWRKKAGAMEVRVHPSAKLTGSTVSSSSVKNTTTSTAKTTTSGNKPTIPSPGDYFGGVDKTNSGNGSTSYSCYDHSTFPKSKVESYVSALKKAGLTGGKIEKQSDGDMLAQLNYKGEWAMVIRWYAKDHYIWCNISDDLSVADEKKTTNTTTTKSNTTTTTKKPTTTTTTTKPSTTTVSTNKDGYLPDITKFMGVRMYDNRASSDGSWQYSITIASDDNGKKALREYAELLQSPEYKLELVDYVDLDYTLIERGHTYQMFFKYNGSKNIKPITDSDGRKWHVCFSVSHIKDVWGLGPSLYVSMDYKDKLIDSGKTASVRVIDNLTNGNEYDPKPSDSGGSKNTVPCGTCNGSGDCTSCGGDGYVYSRASGEEDRNCTSCSKTGKCRSCGGDGWLN